MRIFASLSALLLPCPCPGCGASLARPGLCADCRRSGFEGARFRRVRGPPSIPLWAGAAYQGPVRSLLYDYKFRRRRDLAASVAAWAVAGFSAARRAGLAPSARSGAGWRVVPVPASADRCAARGFDPLAPVARAVAEAAGWPLVAGLRRTRPTRAQSGLGAQDRRENLRGAFAPASGSSGAPGAVLVDDVATSGVTIAAAAAALRAGGVVRVIAVAAAVALPRGSR